MSVLDFLHLGSSLSLRSFVRAGSAVSVLGVSRFGSSMSVLDFVHLGSSLSLRSFARASSAVSVLGVSRFGSSMSVLDFVHLGSSLSLRSFARASSALSVWGVSRFGSGLSVLDIVHLGSSLSLRSFGRFGSGLSVFDFLHLGSSLSVRSFGRFGSSMSVLDFLHLGSSLSLRSFLRAGSSVSTAGVLAFGATNTYMRYNSGIDTVVAGNRGLSVSSTGGTLHGVWSSDNVISASDRRLKKDIIPLHETIKAEMDRAELASASDVGEKKEGSESAQAVSWLLRELRPVSFTFRRGPESKLARYGFIAQELERTLPSVVREKDDYKHVLYQDLIALLTLTAQSQQERLDNLEKEVTELRADHEKEVRRSDKLEVIVKLWQAKNEKFTLMEKTLNDLVDELSRANVLPKDKKWRDNRDLIQ